MTEIFLLKVNNTRMDTEVQMVKLCFLKLAPELDNFVLDYQQTE